MNRWKLCSGLLALVAVLLFASAANAQNFPLIAVGSSGIFPSTAIAAVSGDSIRGVTTPLCGSNLWTGSASANDARSALTSPNIPSESGTVWIAWDNSTAPTVICAMLSVDSIVGQRLFFGVAGSPAVNGTLVIPTTACSTAGGNKVSFVWDTATTGLPVAVWNALMGGNATNASCSNNTNTLAGQHFNAAFTDIRPEDAEFVGASRVLCTDSNSTAAYPPDDKSCMGFGQGVLSPAVAATSSFSTASAQLSYYNISGTDPISGATVPAYTTFAVGAEPVIVFVNTIDTSSAGFGTLTGSSHTLTSVGSHELSALYSGSAILTRDLVSGLTPGTLTTNAIHALQREPMSGTYTTFEWQVIRQRDGLNANSQETGIAGPSQTSIYSSACFTASATAFPTVACSNPVSTCYGATCGLRTRVIGTGQMVSVGNTASWTANASSSATPSILGYAFWSLGSFGGKANIKYLALHGSDALYPSYATGGGNGGYGAFPGVPTGQGTSATVSVGSGQCGGYFNGNSTTGATPFSCNGYNLPTFDGVTSGQYRAWSVLRGVYFGAKQTPSFSPLNVAGFIASAQDQASPSLNPRITDFYPVAVCANSSCSSQTQLLNVFRSHYALPSWGVGSPNNGVVAAGGAEVGGDVAGAIFNSQIEADFYQLFSGNSFLSWIQ
ncbi:MAG TPA: hypothetical protein VMU53_06820 [Candidatus Sulfotelmatobacter sp.]|nr:hypothetical protein [Candidatus Sulfotelmatobacter sp.]